MNSVKTKSWDSKLTPTLIILFVNFGLIFDGEIKIKSLYSLTRLNSSWVIGPIITLTPCDLISWIAISRLFLLVNP